MIAWFIRRSLADALDRRYPVRRLYWLCKFAGGPFRALRRWWALRKTRVLGAEYLPWSAGLVRMPGESDSEFRTRILQHIAAPSASAREAAERLGITIGPGDAHRDEARRRAAAFSAYCGSCGGDGTHPPRMGFDAIEASWLPSITCESCGGDGGLISDDDRAALLSWVTDRLAWHRCDVADEGECSRDELVDWLTEDLGVPAGPIVDACLGTTPAPRG